MPPKIPNISQEEAQQIVITLALIQKALQDMTKRVDDHHKALFGNGNPENSIVWAIKMLTESIKSLEKKIQDNHIMELQSSSNAKQAADIAKAASDSLKHEIEDFKNNDANLTWKQWFKKITIKWLPNIAIIVLSLIVLHEPLMTLFQIILKLIK